MSPYYEAAWDWDGTVSLSLIYGWIFFELTKTVPRERLSKLTLINPTIDPRDIQCVLTARSRENFPMTAEEMTRMGVRADLVQKPSNDDHNLMGNLEWKADWLNKNKPFYYIDDDIEVTLPLQKLVKYTRCISTDEYYLIKQSLRGECYNVFQGVRTAHAVKQYQGILHNMWDPKQRIHYPVKILQKIADEAPGMRIHISPGLSGIITEAWVDTDKVRYKAILDDTPLPPGFPAPFHTPISPRRSPATVDPGES